MPDKLHKFIPTGLKLLLIVIVAAGFGLFWHLDTLPNRVDAQQTIVIGPNRFAPASDAALRVVVQEVGNGQPVRNAAVKVSLQTESGDQTTSLFDGLTDAAGSLPLNFHIPPQAEGDYQLIIETESSSGSDRLEQPITIARDFRLLLSTDKPLYQLGQTIHIRALALDRFDLTPAKSTTIDFLVQDAKGNKVFRQSVPTSNFGVAAVDFILATQVNQGDYKLSATIGSSNGSVTNSEKTVEVRPYVLPKFEIALTTDQTFYTPGQHVEGSIQADYFFGKPVAQGDIQLVGVAYDVERVELINLLGQTDENGHYAFSFDLPDYFAGSGLDSEQAQFALEVTVIDQTDHAEQTSTILPVAAQPIIIEAVAESGTLRPGVENILYILTAYPDGTPAQTDLEIRSNQNAPQTLTTGEYGLAEFHFVPTPNDINLNIQAHDERGFSASRPFQFQVESGHDHVLLRADRAAYVVGETINLTVLTSFDAGSIYLDIVKEGQTLSTRSKPVQTGRTDFAIDLSPDLYGTLELHAYKVLQDGTLVRDTRVVVVDEPRDLSIAITADQDTYLPGDTATINFQTSAQTDNTPVQTVLGLAIVDESVFALQRQDPGFAKLYFMLEAELLEPFYQINGFKLPAAYTPDQANLREAQNASVQAAWSDASTVGLAMHVNSRPEKMETLRQTQRQGLRTLATLAIIGLTLIPLLLWLVVILTLRGSGLIKQSLVGLAKVSGSLLLIFAGLYGVMLFLIEISRNVDWFFRQEEYLLFSWGGAFVLSTLGLIVYAWRNKDEATKFIALLSAGAIALFVLLGFISAQGPDPDEALFIPMLISFILAPGAYLLFGQKLWIETQQVDAQRTPGWLSTIMGGILSIPAIVMPFIVLSMMMPRGGMMLAGGAEPEFMMAPGVAQLERAASDEAAIPPTEPTDQNTAGEDGSATSGDAPRLRQFFPETLYWNPEVATDETGFVQVDVPIADSITTWRLTALASSQDGRLGFTTQGIRVFQDFFVDIDLPVSLTQGDEISIPVGVFNYLPKAQEVRLVVEPEPWFELLDESEQILTIASNDIDVVYFPIRVLDFGQRSFQVTAWGEHMSDAIRREIRVVPNGQEVRQTDSNWLREDKEIALNISPQLVPGTAQVEVKIYAGALSQVVEGLENILRLPYG